MALTAKQEAFCQAIVMGLSQAEAYRRCYEVKKMKPAAVDVEASRLMDNPKVAQRVAELRAPVVARARYGLEQAMAEAEEAFRVAKGKENGGAMVAAATLRAKLNGLLVEKREIRTGPLDGLDHEQLKALDAAIAAISGGVATAGASSTRH